jgi:hypothetical protein
MRQNRVCGGNVQIRVTGKVYEMPFSVSFEVIYFYKKFFLIISQSKRIISGKV